MHSGFRKQPYESPSRFDGMFTEGYTGEFRGYRNDRCASGLLEEMNRDPSLGLSAEELEWIEGLYDGGIRYTDEQVGRLLDALVAHGYDANTWIVVTSDHGEGFRERGKLLHVGSYEEVARVPLIVRPARTGLARRIDGLVSHVDLMPSLLQAMGLPVPPGVQGRSFLPMLVGKPSLHAEIFFTEYGNPGNITVRTPGHSLVTRDGFTDLELYDRASDRGETRDRSQEQPDVAGSLRQRAVEFHAEQLRRAEDIELEGTEVSEAERERLRALGYLE